MKYILLIITFALSLTSAAKADEFNYQTLETIIVCFSDLDKKWLEMINSSEIIKVNMVKSFVVEAKSKIVILSKIHPKSNREFADPLHDYSKIISDAVNDLSQGLLDRQIEESIRRSGYKLMFLPTVTIGVASALVSKENGTKGIALSSNEQTNILAMIEKLFGDRIKGPETINGDTPFALSVSFIDGFIISNR